MTGEKVSKELINEDIIEQISRFVKIHLTETIFPYYDAVYKAASHNTLHDTAQNKSTVKRKLYGQLNNASSTTQPGGGSAGGGGTNSILHNNKAKQMQHFYNKMREILSLVGELVCQVDMTDTIIITLSSLSVMCFFVENINDLQLESLKILTNIFTRYPSHRQLVLDDLLNSLVKLHQNKRNSRLYKCLNGDSIQMFSALLLQLIQCEVGTIDSCQHLDKPHADLTFEEKETFLINSYENSSQTAKKFLTSFFSKCKTKQADSDFRPIFENFIQDLLTTVNKPEWPVSETILNLLGIILVSQIQNEQNDAASRVNSLEYLGQIVSQLRKDSLEYHKYPDKVKQVLDKINQDNELFNLQQSLIGYLNLLVQNDASLQFAKFFLVGQWIKELNQQTGEVVEHDQERVQAHKIAEENRKRLYSLIERKSTDSAGVAQLDMSEAFVLSKYLSSLKKTLDKNFDYYLVNILNLSGGTSTESNAPTQVRSKAIKCLSMVCKSIFVMFRVFNK